jgi:hypothetical protein
VIANVATSDPNSADIPKLNDNWALGKVLRKRLAPWEAPEIRVSEILRDLSLGWLG